ncbi:di-heme oxidoredictase family protein [Haliea sp. E17]|uniref:di-heme oxidoredictase family protein n=1 Tax=Haliea sp. E17 TaxID=3401576 RepID=UPI003AAD0210
MELKHARRAWLLVAALGSMTSVADIGREVALPRHLQFGEAAQLPTNEVLDHGRAVFSANWTIQEGGGRPQTTGTGSPLTDPSSPLLFPRNFNRVSGPDANSCAGCHNAPYGIPGGGGDFVTNVFVLAQRFDFATFESSDPIPTRGTLDESGNPTTLSSIGNSRATVGMFGSGYVEMLARQITADLRAIRDSLAPGDSAELSSKGIDFGRLGRDGAGNWLTEAIDGLPVASTRSSSPDAPPSLTILPFHQAGAVVSLRQFSNNAFNHHHGMQSVERFGLGVDADEDGFSDELTEDDITAVSLFQATLPVPGRVIPNSKPVEEAVRRGEHVFADIGCAGCHIPELPLTGDGHIFTEPGPYNPAGNLNADFAEVVPVNLNGKNLPKPRLHRSKQDAVTWVPVFTDFKLHDITSGEDDPNRETLNMHFPAGSVEFFAGNSQFLTRRLWGIANEPPYFHHGKFTTIREAVIAHAGEAKESREAYSALTGYDQDALIEFLKTLQILPPGTMSLVVDENNNTRSW